MCVRAKDFTVDQLSPERVVWIWRASLSVFASMCARNRGQKRPGLISQWGNPPLSLAPIEPLSRVTPLISARPHDRLLDAARSMRVCDTNPYRENNSRRAGVYVYSARDSGTGPRRRRRRRHAGAAQNAARDTQWRQRASFWHPPPHPSVNSLISEFLFIGGAARCTSTPSKVYISRQSHTDFYYFYARISMGLLIFASSMPR